MHQMHMSLLLLPLIYPLFSSSPPVTPLSYLFPSFLNFGFVLSVRFHKSLFARFLHSHFKVSSWDDTQLFQNLDRSSSPILKWAVCTLLSSKRKFNFPIWKHHGKFRHGTFPTLRYSKNILRLIRGRNHSAKHILNGRSRHVSQQHTKLDF